MKRDRSQRFTGANSGNPYPKPSARVPHSHEDLIDCTQPSLGALKEPQPSTFSSSDPHAALLPSSSRRKSATSASHIPSKSSTLTTKPQAAQRDSTTEGKALKKELAAAQEKVKELERKLMQSERAAADKARSGAGALKKEMLARDGEIRRLEGVVEEKKARCQAMETAYQDSESRRQELEQSTGQMRELFDLGDVGDVQRIVTGLQDLNDAIDEIVFAFVSQLNEHLLQEPLPASLDTFAGWRAVSGRFNAQHFLASVRRSGGNDIKLDDFLHPFLKVVITEELFQVVLGAFHPLIWEASTSSLLQKLYQQVKLEGNRARAAQWRATTFGAIETIEASHRSEFISWFGNSILQELIGGCYAAGYHGFNSKAFLDPMQEQIGRLVCSAFAWQDLHRRQYLYTDFDLIVPLCTLPPWFPVTAQGGLPFDPATMRDVGPAPHQKASIQGAHVVAALSIGLAQLKVRKSSAGKEMVEKTTLVKAEVWTEREG